MSANPTIRLISRPRSMRERFMIHGTPCGGPDHLREHVRKAVCAATVAACLLGGCGGAPGPPPMAVECGPLPDAGGELAQAWQGFQPDRPLTFLVAIRRRLSGVHVRLSR